MEQSTELSEESEKGTEPNSKLPLCRKRVCFLLHNPFVWDNRVKREAKALVDAGYDVTIICLRSKDKKLPKYEVTEEAVRVHRILKSVHKFKCLTLRHLINVIRVLRKYPAFDIVHAHDANTLLMGWILSRLWRCRLVYDSHELWESIFEYEKERILKSSPDNRITTHMKAKFKNLEQAKSLEKWLLSRCDALISVNNTLTEILGSKANERIPSCLTIRNIPGYHHADKKRPRLFHDYFKLDPSMKLVLYQGAIAEIRGISKLIEAFKHIERPDIGLVLMGPISKGEYPVEILAEVSKMNNKKILYKETVTGDELLQWTASADLGIAPILNARTSYYYCLPNKLFEYIQAGIPCAASNFPEMKSLIETYGVGFTFDPENTVEIAEKILDYFDTSREESRRYQENLALAKEELHWENESKKLVALYKSLLYPIGVEN